MSPVSSDAELRCAEIRQNRKTESSAAGSWLGPSDAGPSCKQDSKEKGQQNLCLYVLPNTTQLKIKVEHMHFYVSLS